MPDDTRSFPDRTRPPATDTLPDDPAGPAQSLPPGYELVRELGRGGMGVVYHARQTTLNRDAAVKLILAGGHASAVARIRFVTEGEAVARVRHPHVIQVFEAGTHLGLPFLAMEYLAGGPLSDKLKAGPLPPADAARLLEQIARGVAACHAAGILHRDLKPANVLLDADGTPKVADFGLAKLTAAGDGLTATGTVFGSPSYMAPEQATAARDVGPTADVYGLGATFYDLLTGRPPFQGPSAQETLIQVIHTDPVPVRDLQPTVPPDVQTICMKCLEKDPARRYPTAEALADDLRRWQAGEPILARPAGPVERAGKWVRRNRAAAAVLLTLAVGSGVSSWGAVVARAEAANARAAEAVARAAEAKAVEREEAEKAARQGTDAVSRFLQDVIAQSSTYDLGTPGRPADPNRTVKEALDVTAERLDGRFSDQPRVEAAVRHTVGLAYYRLGQFLPAERHFARAVELWERTAGPDDPQTLADRVNLGLVLSSRGKFRSAGELLADAAARCGRVLGEDAELTLAARFAVAVNAGNAGRDPDAATPLFEQVLADRRRALGDRHRMTLVAVAAVGGRYAARGDPRAGPLLAEALTGRLALFGPDDPSTLESRFLMGVWQLKAGDPATAVQTLRPTLRAQEAQLPPTHPDVLRTADALAEAYLKLGRRRPVAEMLERVRAGQRALRGEVHPATLDVTDRLAQVYEWLGEHAKAEGMLREYAAGLERAGHKDWFLYEAKSRIGAAAWRARRDSAAEAELRAGFDGMTRHTIPERDYYVLALRRTALDLAAVCEGTGRPAEAAGWRARAAEFREPAPRPRRGN